MEIFTYPSERALAREKSIVGRSLSADDAQVAAVAQIIGEVKERGDDALVAFGRRFDAPRLEADDLIVSETERRHAERQVDERFRRALERAARQIRAFHQRQVRNSWIVTERPGTLLGQLIHPVDCAGVYVPGGRRGDTPLVSSVLMGAIPARIAGVPRVVMTTPPRPDGSVNPHLLVAAMTAGVDVVVKAGSAWGIAAMAYGTARVDRCDVIVGPGNVYVTLAKKLVSGTVGIDMIAGPSEILVIADETAVAEFVAADLLSQAEHDPMASAVLVTPVAELAAAVAAAIEEQLPLLPRGEIARAALERFGAAFVVPDLDAAVALANRMAPEHLELLIRDPMAQIGALRHAGAIFMGNYTPEPVGDYVAGPNHVLPTAGTARFSSALSVDHFVKKTSLMRYDRTAFQQEAGDIIRLAETEGLAAHARAVKLRLERGED